MRVIERLAIAAVLAFAVVSGAIGLALKVLLPKGIRVSEEDEVTGLDLSQHNESAYSLGTIGTAGFGAGLSVPKH